MTARSMWKGVIQLGLLTIPIKVYKATEDRGGIELHYLHAGCGQRINAVKTCPEHGVVTDLAKGYEYAKGEHVEISEQELDALNIPSLRALAIEKFIPLDRVLWAKDVYYVAPDPLGAKAFALLRYAMFQLDVQAVAKITFRQRESLCTLAPHASLMLLTTFHWPDEVRDAGDLAISTPEPAEAEMSMARTLIQNYSGEFDPNEYRDNYKEALISLIDDKINGRALTAPPVTAIAPPPDLMAIMAASLEARKQQ